MATRPNGRVICVLVDGLRYDTATREMGFLEALVRAKRARRWCIRAELPSLSRPLYETLHTGLTPVDHGIVGKESRRLSRCENVFSQVRATGGRTAASAFYIFSELYIRCPYDPVTDREVDNDDLAIQNGRFYNDLDMPDSEVIHAGDMLIQRFQPDYMLIHPSAVDMVGHRHGGESATYNQQAATVDALLSQCIPRWLESGYRVIVTSDHGMDASGTHGGTLDAATLVPFYLIGGQAGRIEEDPASQLAVAPTILAAMGIVPPQSMQASPLA